MRTITLKGVTAEDNRREGASKRLSDVEFQSRREMGLCFRCEEKYYAWTPLQGERTKTAHGSREWRGVGNN